MCFSLLVNINTIFICKFYAPRSHGRGTLCPGIRIPRRAAVIGERREVLCEKPPTLFARALFSTE